MGGPAERRPLAQASEPAPEPEKVVQQGLEVDEEGEESDEYDVEDDEAGPLAAEDNVHDEQEEEEEEEEEDERQENLTAYLLSNGTNGQPQEEEEEDDDEDDDEEYAEPPEIPPLTKGSKRSLDETEEADKAVGNGAGTQAKKVKV